MKTLEGGKTQVLLYVFTSCRAWSCWELSVSSSGGVEGTCWCSAIFGDPRRAHPLLVFIKSQKPVSSLQSPCSNTTETHWVLTPFAFLFEAFTSAFPSPVHWPAYPWLLWCRTHGSTCGTTHGVVLCTHKWEMGVAKGWGCLHLWMAGAADHSCTLSADSDKGGLMFLIPECEKTLYQQGHERGNCTTPSPAFLPNDD